MTTFASKIYQKIHHTFLKIVVRAEYENNRLWQPYSSVESARFVQDRQITRALVAYSEVSELKSWGLHFFTQMENLNPFDLFTKKLLKLIKCVTFVRYRQKTSKICEKPLLTDMINTDTYAYENKFILTKRKYKSQILCVIGC